MKPYQCRWGGEAASGCWNVSACGCMPTDAYEEHGPALIEDLRRTLIAKGESSLEYIDKVCAWVSRLWETR